MTYDNNYFSDLYQGIPEGGYNPLIERLLEGAEVRLGCDYFGERSELEGIADKIVFTGKIDQYYGYRFGRLAYRSVRFEDEVLDIPNYQGVAVVNYTEREPAWTRIIEHKHFESFGDAVYENGRTVISREYPTEWHEGIEPFCPVNDERNMKLYAQYKQLADGERNVFFGGRLAEYKYYNIDAIVERALDLAERI